MKVNVDDNKFIYLNEYISLSHFLSIEYLSADRPQLKRTKKEQEKLQMPY